MLNGKLQLYDVECVETLCRQIIRKVGLELDDSHEEEARLAYLVATCWELSLRYDPALDTNHKGFKLSAIITLKRRTIDYDQRIRRRRLKWQFKDRTYERPPVYVDSLDRLGATISEREAHRTDDGLTDLVRVLGEGGSAKPGGTNGSGKKASDLAA